MIGAYMYFGFLLLLAGGVAVLFYNLTKDQPERGDTCENVIEEPNGCDLSTGCPYPNVCKRTGKQCEIDTE